MSDQSFGDPMQIHQPVASGTKDHKGSIEGKIKRAYQIAWEIRQGQRSRKDSVASPMNHLARPTFPNT